MDEPDRTLDLKLKIYVMGVDTQIWGVWGNSDIDALEMIQKQLQEDYADDNNEREILVHVHRYEGAEYQQGSGYGDILTIPGYFEYKEMPTTALDV